MPPPPPRDTGGGKCIRNIRGSPPRTILLNSCIPYIRIFTYLRVFIFLLPIYHLRPPYDAVPTSRQRPSPAVTTPVIRSIPAARNPGYPRPQQQQLKPSLSHYPTYIRHSSRHETRPYPPLLPNPNPDPDPFSSSSWRTPCSSPQPRPGRDETARDGVSTTGDARKMFFVVYPERDGETVL